MLGSSVLRLMQSCFSHTDVAVQETQKLLQEAYLSEESQPLWTGAPELLQFDRRLGRTTDGRLKDTDYSSRFETLEHFSSRIETVSIKSFVNAVAIATKDERFFLIKGPPGSGRTALLKRVCAFWARGFCLRKFTLVFWLDLKAYPSAPSDASLKTLLSYSLPQGCHLDSILKWLERHGTQNVLIVIDGVESQACNEWKTFLSGVLGDTKASVILAAAHSIQIVDHTKFRRRAQYMNLCQYDLLGLSQDQISKQVIHHYRHDPFRAEEFLMYISESHDIKALCFSPPYLAAVLFVFDRCSTRDLPNAWTQLFTSLKRSLFRLSDHITLTILANLTHDAYYAMTSTKLTLKWHHSYTNFCHGVTPPYHTLMTTTERCCFTLPLLQYYLCSRHIHSLPHDQHVPILNTIPFYVRQFYVGLCTSLERVQPALTFTEDTLIFAVCISEATVKGLQYLMSSELTFEGRCLSSFDVYYIFQAVHYSGLQCKLKFHHCHFGLPTLEMMARWLTAYSISPSGGAVQKLRCVCGKPYTMHTDLSL